MVKTTAKFICILASILSMEPSFSNTTQATIDPPITKAELEQYIKSIDLTGWSKFGESLKACSPNTFSLPAANSHNHLRTTFKTVEYPKSTVVAYVKIMSMPIVYKIMGWSNDKCLISISSPMANGFETKCLFPKEDLLTFSQFALKLGLGKPTESNEFSKIMESNSVTCTDNLSQFLKNSQR